MRSSGHSTEPAWLILGLFAFMVAGVAGAEDGHLPAQCKHPQALEDDVTFDLSGGVDVSHGGERRLLATHSCTSCSGHGACTSISQSQSLCDCFTGWAGHNCSEVVNCAPRGWCSGKGICVKGGECACNPGWEGPNCTVGKCPKDCSSNGICDITTRQCGCFPGWSGRACSVQGCAMNCSSHGDCVDGECECAPGFAGFNCENFICINKCSGHGVCRQAEMRCDCSPWFTGEDCSIPLCPYNCTGHGSCVDGKCICDAGWSGSACASHLCPNACSGRGTCESGGVCICQTGYTGSACDLLTACDVYDCSGHGTCRISDGQNATCDCDPGWSGAGCGEPTALAASLCVNNCSSHGLCINGTLCLCDDMWRGDDCSLQIGETGCPSNCQGRGSCLNGTCACDYGFYGMDCNSTDSALLCTGIVCSTGQGAVWGNGSCHCEYWMEGGASGCPMNCSGHGSCFNGTCGCDLGWAGAGCQEALVDGVGAGGACVNNCSSHGSCFNGTSCVCDHGWMLDDCSLPVSAAMGCPSNCTGHGACSGNNTCICDPGFLGSDCSLEVATAPPCAFNCSSRGVCVNSTCACLPGYGGVFCESDGPGSTPTPTGGYHNASRPSDGACPGDGCSGHGACNQGVCTCDPFWRGVGCGVKSAVIIPDCPVDCSMHGTCLNGTCMCDPMWDGDDCSYPSLCPGYTQHGAGNCTGHGTCLNGTCICNPSWTGVDCSIESCPGGCGGFGTCANGTCACDMGWAGFNCDRPGCPSDCSGHGSCSEDLFGGPPVCTCMPGWSGSGCADPVCPTSKMTMNPYVACSGHGACFQDGTCLCYENYAGEDCGILMDCSGRGVRKCGFCECEDGFDGDLCEVDICEDSRIYKLDALDDWRSAEVCSGRGRCTTLEGCICEVGWAGKNCTVPAVCQGSCQGGTCSGSRDDPGTCDCGKYDTLDSPHDTYEWTGKFCTFQQCPGYRGITKIGDVIECSGKGSCNEATYECTCFLSEGEGLYKGEDCGIPPKFKVENIAPRAGPLEGGTHVTLFGTGLERVVPLLEPAVLYCDFGVPLRTPALIGPVPDTMVCYSPPVSLATPDGVFVKLTDAKGTPFPEIENIAKFEYFAQTRIIRLTPSFGPLRPQGRAGELRGPDTTNKPNMITITGTYFPPNGIYKCRFGDCDGPETSTVRVDSATVVCQMPIMQNPGKIVVSVTSNGQQYSNTVGNPSTFTVFGIQEISPKCASSTGVAMLTVKGQHLVDPDDNTRNPNDMYCRFGRVTLSGTTRSAGVAYQPGFKLFAFHSQAVFSTRSPGALECRVPDWPIETDDFALTLAAEFLVTNTVLKDGYYVGQWDATPSITFASFYQPAITILKGPGNQELDHPYIVEPTLGPVAGGTRVTVAGLGFDFARYGPNSGNDLFAPWTPSKAHCNVAPIPSCKFGTSVTRKVEILNRETMVCITPFLAEPIDQTSTVVMSVALDGQTYSSAIPMIQFAFHPVHRVDTVFPEAGLRTGGTTITVKGDAFVDTATGDEDASPTSFDIRLFPKVMTCVFVSVDTPSVRFRAASARFISPAEVHCVTPSIPAPGKYRIDVSLSGQMEDTQLAGSELIYIFYQDPFITELRDDIGSIHGGEVINVVGENFLDLPTLRCRFGSIVVPGAFADGNIQCVAPEVQDPQSVAVEISMNGADYSSSVPQKLYTFYDIVHMSPSSGPAHGGTTINIKIDGGPGLVYIKGGVPRFNFQVIIGNLVDSSYSGEYDPSTDTIVFSPPVDAITGRFKRMSGAASDGPLDVRLALTASRTFQSFPGRQYIIYTSSFSSILPCTVLDCRDLVVPKNNIKYPITFAGQGLVDVDTVKCAFLPMDSSQLNAAPAMLFQTFDKQPGGIMMSGVYNVTEDLVYCTSPAVAGSASLDGYYVAIALNGQNFVGRDQADETFALLYLPQPTVHSISTIAGVASGGLAVTVTASSWNYPRWYKPNQAPPTLSCIFFLPARDTFKFVQAQNPSCNATGLCTTVCVTPDFSMHANVDGVLVRSQLFISLNRRDPCMKCGCEDARNTEPILGNSGFGSLPCSNADSVDRSTALSRFDLSTNGFCSTSYRVLADTHFCKGTYGTCPLRNALAEAKQLDDMSGISIDDVEFKCLGTNVYQGFTFYKQPVISSIKPMMIGGHLVHNVSTTTGPNVVLYGDFFQGSQWSSWPGAQWPQSGQVSIRLTYVDAQTFSTVISAQFDSAKSQQLTFKLPVPCADLQTVGSDSSPLIDEDTKAACYKNTGIQLNQTNDMMEVHFEISFNGGAQFSPVPLKMLVYKDLECPTEGCGHGACVLYDQTAPYTNDVEYPLYTNSKGQKRSRVPVCYCGYWADDDTRSDRCLPSQGIDSEFPINFRRCKKNMLWYDEYSDPDWLSEQQVPPGAPARPDSPQTMWTLWDKWGRPGVWPHHNYPQWQPQEIGCNAGPIVTNIRPTTGGLSGGTMVTVTLKLESGMSWSTYTSKFHRTGFTGIYNNEPMPASLDSFFRCVLDEGPNRQNTPVGRVQIMPDGLTAKYNCSVPPVSDFQVPVGAYDVNFAMTFRNPTGLLSPKLFDGTGVFKYRAVPVITAILMEVGGLQMPMRNASMPLCFDACTVRNKIPFAIILQGSGFFQTDDLSCRINGILTRAHYKSPTQVNCTLTPLSVLEESNVPAVAGSYAVEFSLNSQPHEFVSAGSVDFFDQPAVVNDVNRSISFGVDPGMVGTSTSKVLGTAPCVGSQCNTKMQEYAQLGPTSGGTPIVLYVQENALTSRVNQWSQRGNVTVLFGECESRCPLGTPDSERYGPKCGGTPVCSCTGAYTSPAKLLGSQPGAGVDKQMYKLGAVTPPVHRTGKYMMCLSMNGVHFHPMSYSLPGGGTDVFYFRYYQKPMVTSLSLSDGPIKIPFQSYSLDIFGDNFPVKTTFSNCEFVEVGLCEGFSPRVYVHIGFKGSIVGGYGSMQQLVIQDYGSSSIQVTSSKLSMVMPDMSLISSDDFFANITISFNGFDFTPVVKGVTEFGFYRIPIVYKSLSPSWGHFDATTDIIIKGENFQPTLGRAMCRISSCIGDCTQEAQGGTKAFVPATFVSPTEMKCTTVARPPFTPTTATPLDKSRSMFVSFTPDGRASVLRDNPVMYELITFPVGKFSLTNEIKFMNVSTKTSTTVGGASMTVVIINHKFNQACFDMTNIETVMVGLIPTAGVWKLARPPGYGDFIPAKVTSKRYQKVNNLLGNFEVDVCLMYINITLPVIPYPLEADIKISVNNGQQFTGPSMPMLFYRPSPPDFNVPTRGRKGSVLRPLITVYFDQKLFEGANPEFNVVQTVTAFARTLDCDPVAIGGAQGICALGPKCRFRYGNTVRDSNADFTFDPFRSLVTCTAPVFPFQAEAEVAVSLDGVTFIAGPTTAFLFFDAPRVKLILPTIGFWSSRTNLLVEGSGFLDSTGDVHLTWCLFDYRDVLPKSDEWNVPRRWTKAYIYPNSNSSLITCRTPVVSDSERPGNINPRARVGVIIDGICQEQDAFGNCILLKNSDAQIVSDAFFLYTDLPTVTHVRPVAALASGGKMKVTITGLGFINSYTWGPPAGWTSANPDPSLPVGYTTRVTDKLCASAHVTSPRRCPGLSCRFGQACPADRLSNCTDRVIDAELNSEGDVICTPPILSPSSRGSNTLQVVDLAVSLNGMTHEFSNSMPFVFTNLRVVGPVHPIQGIAFGGGLVTLTGEQFVNVTCSPGSTEDCLTCLFTSSAQLGSIQYRAPATYMSSRMIRCTVPSTSVFGMDPVTVPESDVCGEDCTVFLSASVNGVDFVPATKDPSVVYRYLRTVDFFSFTPNSGPITGNTTITVSGNGFAPQTNVWCRVGSQVVKAKYRSLSQMICMVPPVAAATMGGVFIGFSTNSVDFCEIVGVECIFSTLMTAAENPFFYHDSFVATNIVPPSGARDGGTEVVIVGSGFSDYGQAFYTLFKELKVACTGVNATAIRCISPPMPTFVLDPNGVEMYILDVAVVVLVTSNQQQFTPKMDGENCKPNPDIVNDDNPRASCTDPFVMWTWFKLPSISSIAMADGQDVPFFNSQLNPALYPDLVTLQGQLTLPQGPTSGGTKVVIKGDNFISYARSEITNGPGVICPKGNRPALPGESCTTTCTFPFKHSITGSSVLYYECINLKRLSDQGTYNPLEFWCAIHGTGPGAAFAGEYGTCRNQISTFRDFQQGGKVVTNLECLFGTKHVPAVILDNSTITCDSPPSDYGMVVPLSVTLNRRDYSIISARTQFQYIAPAPLVTIALLNTLFTLIDVNFDVATNKAGLLDSDGVLKNMDPSLSGCALLFDDSFIKTLGAIAPKCQWLPDFKTLQITPSATGPTFILGDQVKFKKRGCEAAGTCWKSRASNDLLSAPTAKPGCYFPRISVACNGALIQSHLPSWCGRCIPVDDSDPKASVSVVSYPFNQSNATIRISPPLETIAPQPVITGFANVDSCARACKGGAEHGRECKDNAVCGEGVCVSSLVTLTGYATEGQLGRDWRRIRWYVNRQSTTSDPIIVSKLQQQVAGLTNLEETIFWDETWVDNGLVNRGKYCFMLELQNWLGVIRNSSCHQVERSLGMLGVPQIEVMGGTERKSLKLSQELSIAAMGKTSACASNVSTLMYAWNVRPQPVGWNDGAFLKISNNLNIPPFAAMFQTDVPYTFTLNATLKVGIREVVAYINVHVTFTPQAPVATIAGGNSRHLGASETLILDGGGSYDRDIPITARSTLDLVYCWSCVTKEGMSCYLTNSSWYSPVTGRDLASPQVHVPPGVLLQQSSEYHVTLTVAKRRASVTCAVVLAPGSKVMQSSTTQTVKVAAVAKLPMVSIAQPLNTPLTKDMTIRISGYVGSSNCPALGKTVENCGVKSYVWSVDQHELLNAVLESQMTTRADVGMIYGGVTLTLDPGTLIENQACDCYTFRLKVLDQDGMTVNEASITLPYNSAPASGMFTVSTTVKPEDAEALSTDFVFDAPSWSDVHTPLMYQFFFTATTYGQDEMGSITVQTPAAVIPLGPPQPSSTLTTALPQGDVQAGNSMVVYCRIYDSLGASTEVSKSITIKPFRRTPQSILMEDMYTTFTNELKRFEQMRNNVLVYRLLSVIGNVLADPAIKNDVNFRARVSQIRLRCLDAITTMNIVPTAGRRGNGGSEDDVQAISSVDDRRAISADVVYKKLNSTSDAVAVANSLYSVLSSIDPLMLDQTDAEKVVDQIYKQVATSVIPLGVSEAEEKSTLKALISTLGICQNAMSKASQSSWTDFGKAVQGLLVNYMRGKSDTLFETTRNGLQVMAKRIPTTMSGITTTMTLSAGPKGKDETVTPTDESVKFTDRILSGVSGTTLGAEADVQVVAYNKLTNPFNSSSKQIVSSRVVSVNVFNGLPVGSTLVPTNQKAVTISGLAAANRIEINLYPFIAPPAQELNESSGVYRATVCAWYNSTSTVWEQFHTGYLVQSNSIIRCMSDHLTDFATTPGTVGCDFRASNNPATVNECRECGGGTPKKMQRICDWEAKPCYGEKDRCGVCGGKNVSFINDRMRNVTGVCNYLGVPCTVVSGEQQEPTICGICDSPSQRSSTMTNAGICDCQGTGVPNGGKVLDRCKICDGGNATMDFCGHSHEIPDEFVCHTGGVTNSWNSSCKGCDGVPRPDLPWVRDRDEFKGGVQKDVCKVCGGNGANCTGCDGVMGSNAERDVCGVCKGTKASCKGCDDISSVPPKQLDSCGKCGGSNFGACDTRGAPEGKGPCNYKTLTPKDICRQGCDGVPGSGAKYDKCGKCKGDGTSCSDIPECRANSPLCPGINKGCACEACAQKWKDQIGCMCNSTRDACGKCQPPRPPGAPLSSSEDGSSCLGCDGVAFSGKVYDLCGICDGDNSQCLGCDGVVNSGKKIDSCGICDGKDATRDIAGVCGGDMSSAKGCDGVIFSGKALDACQVCGGTNLCKWRDGDPPAESKGSTDAVNIIIALDSPAKRRSLLSNLLGSEYAADDEEEVTRGALIGSAAGLAMGILASLVLCGRKEED